MSFLQDIADDRGKLRIMTLILQDALPEAMLVEKALPGVAPCMPEDWLRVDEAYAAQMAYRTLLMETKADRVLWMDPLSLAPAQEVLEEALNVLPSLGFDRSETQVRCPDGRTIAIDWDAPLRTLGHLVQEDICILEKRGEEHVLTGAVLCFPANWRLAEKVGRPLTAIHDPVAEYDGDIARRVQRMFDGVRVGKPIWRFNRLPYRDADLHQPQRKAGGEGPYIRSERQCILRLPQSQAVVFSIHTYVIAYEGGRATDTQQPG